MAGVRRTRWGVAASCGRRVPEYAEALTNDGLEQLGGLSKAAPTPADQPSFSSLSQSQ
jgi:hypothetical protein